MTRNSSSLCRDCFFWFELQRRCPKCRSPRIITHAELRHLSIAHMDCDAFYASVEKRDHPEWRDKPLIIGGNGRSVVSTCCYLARIRGVRSAMPMFQALKLCPEAIVAPPRIETYAEVSRAVRAMMMELTPTIEPLSLDEAFLDLSGTERLHGAPPAEMLARLTARMETELGITGSIGLSHNKFLAKIASDLDKPRGFSVIGKTETPRFLENQPVGIIWGVGSTTKAHLDAAGIRQISDLLQWGIEDLTARFGQMGERLYHLARGQDHRAISPNAPVKSISKETTFDADLDDVDLLDAHLWVLAGQVSDRAKAKDLAGKSVTLKLKTSDFKTITRRRMLHAPTKLADQIYRHARDLLDRAGEKGPFRLIGCGISDLRAGDAGDQSFDLLDATAAKRAAAEAASDAIRAKFGKDAIFKGRALRLKEPKPAPPKAT